MRRLIPAIALAAGVLLALPAAAQFQKPEDAIKYRQSVMFLQGQHMARLGAMANGRVPFDAKVAQDNAAILDVIDHMPFGAFVDGTDKGNTRAKPEIWTERAKFDAAAVGAVGAACKACHDAYQRPAN